MKIILVVGARPNFIKIAPIIDEIKEYNRSSLQPISYMLVHTGQHYDERMSNLFFRELGIPAPDIDLGVGPGSHAGQTAAIMTGFEKICISEKPTHVLVVGDVNSTIACALVASKMNIKIIHVEAGLRSFDRTMPEEINRILTDAISDYLFVTEKDAEENLIREGIDRSRIFFVGNVMIDTLLKHREKALSSGIVDRFGLRNASAIDGKAAPYCVLTLHRPSNVDDPRSFREILDGLNNVAAEMPVIFPAHPRTGQRIREFNLGQYFVEESGCRSQLRAGIHRVEPLGYLDFLSLMSQARLIMTDSGGIQEEATVLGVPCITLRENTERPVTVSEGTNILAGTDKEKITSAALFILNGIVNSTVTAKKIPPLWDGRAAHRIVGIMTSLAENVAAVQAVQSL